MSLSSQVLSLEEAHKELTRRLEETTALLEKRNQTIATLRRSLRVERLRGHLFAELLRQKTDIDVDALYREDQDGTVHVQGSSAVSGPISVIVQDYAEGEKRITLPVKKRTGFRAVKGLERLEERPEEQEEKVRKAEDAIEEIVKENNLDVSYTETHERIEALFEEVVKNRIYKKCLVTLRETRSKLLGKLNLADYTALLKTHVRRLEDIFLKKKYDQKKSTQTIVYSLSALDQRLLYYGYYYNSELEPDDIQRLKLCMKVNGEYPTRYVPFSPSEAIEKVCNYAISVTTLRETFARVISNPFGFPNLVYLPLEKSGQDDPYSFYVLERIENDGKRYWKMECRLEDVSRMFSDRVLTYCVSLFRKVYFDMFNDNLYREDYGEKSPAAHQDCEQLLVNMLELSQPKRFCNLLRGLVAEHSVIQPATVDKFNFTRDDPVLKRNFAQLKDDPKETIALVQRLFDNISEETAEAFWRLKSVDIS